MYTTTIEKLSQMLKDDVCFVAGTPVWTERGLVPIEQIRIGDQVWSKSDVTGEVAYKPVVQTFVTADQEIVYAELVSSVIEDDKRVSTKDYVFATANHPVWVVNKGWTSLVDTAGGWDIPNLARRNDETCEILDAFPVYEVPGEANLGAIIFNHSEEFCFLVEFDGTINYLPRPKLGQRFSGGTPRYSDNFQTVSDLYVNEADPGDYQRFRTTVYNIEVADFHTYFVGELGLWVHAK